MSDVDAGPPPVAPAARAGRELAGGPLARGPLAVLRRRLDATLRTRHVLPGRAFFARWGSAPRRVLLVVAHPLADSFVQALASRVAQSLHDAGHVVELLDLYGCGFDPALGRDDWRARMGRAPVGSAADTPSRTHQAALCGAHQEALRRADALVFVYPTWFGAQPAILKGWFDRVWAPGVAYALPEHGTLIRPLLRNIRSITVVTTHGSGKPMNVVQGEPGKRVILRGLRSLCHPRCRTRWIAFYGTDRRAARDREAFLQHVGTALSARP